MSVSFKVGCLPNLQYRTLTFVLRDLPTYLPKVTYLGRQTNQPANPNRQTDGRTSSFDTHTLPTLSRAIAQPLPSIINQSSIMIHPSTPGHWSSTYIHTVQCPHKHIYIYIYLDIYLTSSAWIQSNCRLGGRRRHNHNHKNNNHKTRHSHPPKQEQHGRQS